jgi:hypothetical protein
VKGTTTASLCRLMVCIGLPVLLVAAGCSTGGDVTPSSVPSPGCGSAAQAGPAAARDEISPLVVTGVAPDPIPVKGTDGKYHVAYELAVLNAAPRATTLIKVETLTDDAAHRVLTTLQGDELVTRTLRVGSYPREPSPVTSIPAGQTALLLLDDVYDDRGAIPPAVTHRVEASFAPPAADQREVAGVYPDQVSQIGGSICHSSLEPPVIAPPLQGDGWVALNACCTVSPHRSAMLPLGGRINGTERFAVDWVRFDLSAQPLVDAQTGVAATFRGDPTRNENYLAYNQPLLAVADATVVSVVSDVPDQPPHVFPTGLRLDQYGGNQIILDLGAGTYAFYAHLKPGSASVRAGDRVTKGQQIGNLGNSGNSSEAHLHFHLMNSPLPLTGENLPFQIDRFEFLGTVTLDGLTTSSPPGPRTNELPLAESTTNYPIGPAR